MRILAVNTEYSTIIILLVIERCFPIRQSRSAMLATRDKEVDIMFAWDDEDRDSRRTLGIRDKQILYRNAKGRCENPACKKKIDFDEMQVGHKTAWSKRGRTTLANSVCLCYRCNKLQGTDSWATFLKKQGKEDPKLKQKKTVKQALEALSVAQLKTLAKKHQLEVKGDVVEDIFTTRRLAPTKSAYVRRLSKVVTPRELQSAPKEPPKTVKKKKA